MTFKATVIVTATEKSNRYNIIGLLIVNTTAVGIKGNAIYWCAIYLSFHYLSPPVNFYTIITVDNKNGLFLLEKGIVLSAGNSK